MTQTTGRKVSWAQPSLSRDFALLSAAIVFIMLLISAWVAWITYVKHSERILTQLEKETERVERTLESEIATTGYMLKVIGKQVANVRGGDLSLIAELLQTYASGNPQYAIWNWSDVEHRIVVSSTRGVLDDPVNIAERDYVSPSEQSPWSTVIGAPVEGKVSGKWVIPVAIGVTDSTGKYIGTLTAAIDIDNLTMQISHLVKREGISFAVVSKTFVPLTVVADSDRFRIDDLPLYMLKNFDVNKPSKGVMSQAGLFSRGGIYSYYLISGQYPYIIVVGYDNQASETAIRSLLWPRIIQIAVVAAFLLSFLWIIRSRVIKPVIELSQVASQVAAGEEYKPLSKSGSQEIEFLSMQIGMISEYLAERHLIEDELRNKIFQFHQRQQRIQMEIRQRSVLLAGLLAEYKKSLRNINSHAQVLKDQLYGPIEDKKYRQYAADIHQTGTTLELMVRKLIALSRVDAAAIITRDEPVALTTLLENARRFVGEALEGGAPFMILPEESLGEVVLQVDSLHVQQALAYAMLYLAAQPPADTPIAARLMSLPASKGEEDLVLALGKGNAAALDVEAVRQALDASITEALHLPVEDGIIDQMHYTLAHAMLQVQHIPLTYLRSREAGSWVLVMFPARRLLQRHQRQELLD